MVRPTNTVTDMPPFPNANHAAFATVVPLAAGTVASAVGAAMVASTVHIVALATLAVTLGAILIASVTAWIDPKSKTASDYFNTLGSHAGIAVAGTYTFVAETLVTKLVQACGNALGDLFYEKITGNRPHAVRVL